MQTHRTRLEIYGEILEICKKGANISKIVYRANSNFKLTREYLAFLKSKALVTQVGKLWKTTFKGMKLLDHLRSLNLLLAN